QLTGAAYTIDITNTATLSRTFNVTLGGLPAGWGLLDGQPGSTNTSRSLPAGAVGQIGLYISPTVATLPPAGTSYPFTLNVQAQDNPAISAGDSASFTVPALPYPHLQYQRTLYYAAPNSTITVTAAITNLGNSPATFPITNVLSALNGLANPTVTPATGSATLAAGASSSFDILVNTSGTTPGELYGLRSETAGGPYTLIDAASLIIVNPAAICAYDSAAAVAAA
ncbi:MAG: hypothetical protein KDE29_19290, partial [Anaerolineales bacterium]|nr:hypothetical protein [Anaerolineales bacterium]